MDRSNSHTGASSPIIASPHTTNANRRVSAAVHNSDEDRGLTMREKEQNGSMGKAGGVSSGVTRPKRRLSSLPTQPHPFFAVNRAMSTNSMNSPPSSPKLSHPHSTYQTMQNHKHDQSDHSQPTYNRANPPRLDGKVGMVSYATQMAAASREKEGPPMLWGIELKWISLITLALQNAFLTIIMHYSRISTAPGKTYSAATAVLLNELLKGSISVIIALKRIDTNMSKSPIQPPAVYTEKSNNSKNSDRRFPSTSSPSSALSIIHPSRITALTKAVFSPDCYKLSVPAILYVIQNNLQYVAASNLDVATFQVTYQMKILTTAFFSVLMLRKRLSKAKWASLVMLAIGVGIVQMQSTTAPATSHAPPPSAKINHGEHQLRSDIPGEMHEGIRMMHPLKGFLAVTLACMTSGLAGVYFEFILKSSSGNAPPPDLWVRNTQLSLFSLIPALVPIVVAPAGPEGMGYVGRVMSAFSNFNGWAIGTVLTQTLGGLITALVIRYSDNIMKGFATSLSIVISFLASVALFSYPITLAFVTGSSIVLTATYIYNSPSSSAPSSRTTVAVAPGSPITTNAPILGEPEKKPSRTSSVINLLGLSNSLAGSRKPSSSDLKSQSQSHLSFTSTPMYSASAPGTPYLGNSGSGRGSPNPSGQYLGGPAQIGGPGTGFGREKS
nr:solute carrier family 35 (UDP-sugar transporter), member A1/2/3 [Kwoniella bestiolae CBS 10118]OCF25484.1 solute carrier family 35 (UDP-sugar transporter), member A1/2/3 [Kwoniella bestiolae CBS 10118]